MLCDLEGQTYEQAARELQCPLGTVQSRLARARGRLRERLVRRGLAPSVVGMKLTSAAVPASLHEAAVRSAMCVAAGGGTAGVVPAGVVELVEEVIIDMIRTSFIKVAGGIASGCARWR